jgi:hypothetical protein
MVQSRLIRSSFLLILALATAGLAASQPPVEEPILRSWLDDLSARPTLQSLTAAEADFRGCDRDGNHVVDFWTADVSSLYTLKAEEADARANDRDWCHVNDFWSDNVAGIYTMADVASFPSDDATLKLIEISVAAGEAP